MEKAMARLIVVLVFPFATAAFGQTPPGVTPTPTTDASAADQSPSYDDTVKWIQDNISLAGAPASSSQHNGNITTTNSSSDAVTYLFTVDGCKSMTFTRIEGTQTTQTHHFGSGLAAGTEPPPNHISSATKWRFKIPFSSVVGFTLFDKSDPGVGIMIKDGAGTLSGESSYADNDGPQTSITAPVPITTVNFRHNLAATSDGGVAPFVLIGYSNPDAEDAIPHMTAALKHLVDICKANPKAGKDLF
ncbi:MAG: hypothetical protein WCD49_15130 [Candidatus Acidiferrales bacterium]